jgi:hypothetical protein
MRETGTPFFGKFSVAKSSIAACAAFVFASGFVVLFPTQASAQLNIDGLIRGAIGGGGYGYRGPSHHSSSSSHSSSHHDDSDDDSAADIKNGKGIKSTNGGDNGNSGSSGSGSGTPQSASTDSPPKGGPSGGSSGPGGGSSSAPPKSSGDEPSFSPSR